MSAEPVSDRLSGRVDSKNANHLIRGSDRSETRDDLTPQHAAGPQLAPRLERLNQQLTETDHLVIDILAQVRMASGGQLNRLIWPTTPSGARACRRRLERLSDLRVVTRLHRQVGGVKGGSQGYTYALDVNGQRLAQTRTEQSVRRPAPSDLFVDHTLGVTEVYVILHEAPGVELLSFETEPSCWRQFTGRAGRTVNLRPDAYLAWAIGEWEISAFVEVDRSTEHPGRIARKAEQYVRYWRTGAEQRTNEVFPTVLWLANTGRRAEVLRAVLAEQEAPLWEVLTMGELPEFITNTRKEGQP